MQTASRILGDQVGSTAPVFLAFLAVHVVAGLTAVATGATAALTRKGGSRHIRAGRWYYWAITVVFATAAVLAAMRWRQDYYLFVIGAIAYAAATIGYQHRRRHRPGDTGHITGMGVAYVAMLTAFYLDNGPHLPLWDRLPTLAFWLLPSAIAGPIIARAVLRARRARSAGRTAARTEDASPGTPRRLVLPHLRSVGEEQVMADFRASNADREQVVATLGVAFVQGRLTKDEFDLRVGQALVSRTYAELAAVTADLPAGLAAAQPAEVDPAPRGRSVWGPRLVRTVATVIYAGMWPLAAVMPVNNEGDPLDGINLIGSATLIYVLVMILAFLWAQTLDPRQDGTGPL